MSAYKERREALLRAHMIDINAGDGEPAPSLTTAEERERRVTEYAARVAAGRPLHPGQRLTRRDRLELEDTDGDAGESPRLGGRPTLASRVSLPFALRLNRDCRRAAARQAEQATGGPVPVPAFVRQQFPAEQDLPRKWAEYVRSLARGEGRGRG